MIVESRFSHACCLHESLPRYRLITSQKRYSNLFRNCFHGTNKQTGKQAGEQIIINLICGADWFTGLSRESSNQTNHIEDAKPPSENQTEAKDEMSWVEMKTMITTSANVLPINMLCVKRQSWLNCVQQLKRWCKNVGRKNSKYEKKNMNK